MAGRVTDRQKAVLLVGFDSAMEIEADNFEAAP
jgi:hypothetical protein